MLLDQNMIISFGNFSEYWYTFNFYFVIPIRNMARQEAVNTSAQRYPQPQIMLFNESSSMSRFLLCRLGPDHKDHLNSQLVRNHKPGVNNVVYVLRSTLILIF